MFIISVHCLTWRQVPPVIKSTFNFRILTPTFGTVGGKPTSAFLSLSYFFISHVTFGQIRKTCQKTDEAMWTSHKNWRGHHEYSLKHGIVHFGRVQSFTSLKVDLHQDINGGFAFGRCLNGTFPWRKCSIKALVS